MSDYITHAMGAACGVIGWSPDDFWHATPFDLLYAWQGFKKFHGLKSGDELTQDDVMQLRTLLNETTNGL